MSDARARRRTNRRARSGIWIAAFAMLSFECPVERASAQSDQESQARIESMIHSWFAVLDDPVLEADALDAFLPEAPFELQLTSGVVHDRDELHDWLKGLHATQRDIRYRIGTIRLDKVDSSSYRAHFEVDRSSSDAAGIPHVARSAHTWLIRDDSRTPPFILSIEEQPLLFFPGTGPQIICD